MKKDIILSGVGGQGILSIATVIGEAATRSGLFLKQAEVHGMSQRGGEVQSCLRLSDSPIFSDLIPLSGADLIVSMEPMEALRHLPFLCSQGVVISSSRAFENIPLYPSKEEIAKAFGNLGSVVTADIEQEAIMAGAPKGANMVLLGMAARYIEILSAEQLEEAVTAVFERKGDSVVRANLKCFNIGKKLSENAIVQ